QHIGRLGGGTTRREHLRRAKPPTGVKDHEYRRDLERRIPPVETAMTSSEHDLRKGALSGFDSLVMAVAGSAPAYSIAASTAVLIAAVGLASPAALLYCAIPMLGIAWAFNYLGRADVNAGASYAWVGRALHPSLGFISGWALIVSATIFMVAGSLPAGSMTLSLFSDTLADDTVLVTVVGAAWFLVMVGLVIA